LGRRHPYPARRARRGGGQHDVVPCLGRVLVRGRRHLHGGRRPDRHLAPSQEVPTMPTLWDRPYPRGELLRRVGRLEQVAGVRLMTLGDGASRGVRVLEFRTGTGFSFDVLIDRSFHIGRCEEAGRSLAWISNVGVSGPWYTEHEDWSWFRSWGGGM